MLNRTMDLVLNKKALFDYEVIESFITGIVLTGTEVRSLRNHQGNLKGSWVKLRDGELWLQNMHISAYKFADPKKNHAPIQPRKLLMTKREIERIDQKQKEKGYTLVLTKIFTQGRYIKCELVLGKGKKKFQKKQSIKDRDTKRSVAKELKNLG